MSMTYISLSQRLLIGVLSIGPLAVLAGELHLKLEENGDAISVFRRGQDKAILVQNARPDFRPYIHPMIAPDGNGTLTEMRPERHQTGLFWAFTRVNGRDYSLHPEGTHWLRRSVEALESQGELVRWRTVYDRLDENGSPTMTETQTWSMRDLGDRYLLDLEWLGKP